jgi:Glycosyltransferase family 87
MTNARRDGLLLLLLGGVVFVLMGIALERSAPSQNVDFRVVYYPARCVLEHQDPYNRAELMQLYRAEGGDAPTDSDKIRNMVAGYVYLPNAFTFTLPLALLPWGPAHILWQALIISSYLLASFLVWSLAGEYAPLAAGAWICLMLINSELLLVTCNSAGIVISLGVIAVWCFLRNRYVGAGMLCLAIALVVKPQDAGLVWLYFVLAGGINRKRAVQTLLLTVALSLPSALWINHAYPHWMQEWRATMVEAEARGGTSDPGPASQASHGLAMVVSLQSVLSVLDDDSHFYNTVTRAICGPMLLLWGFIAWRRRGNTLQTWLALATIGALTLLPVYHRQYDARLLLLTVPACILLMLKGGWTGRLAILVNLTAFLLTGDITWGICLGLIDRLHLAGGSKLQMALEVFPPPLSLLAVAAFYLFVYARQGFTPTAQAEA